jgi:arylsulfatase A-like enzyme
VTITSRPHLVLVCIDALRADCLGPYSFDHSIWSTIGRPVTKALDTLASSSRVYTTAVAASSWTKPSVPSLFQSLHPSEHGVFEVAKDPRRTVLSTSLPSEVPTLAEILKADGYRTIGLTHNAQLDAALGFSRGFDFFTSDAGNGDAILGKLRDLRPFEGGEPIFTYLHYIEPHWPYDREIVRRAREHECGRFPFHRFKASQWKTLKRDLKSGAVELTADEIDFLRMTYRLAVEAADRAVEKLLDWLDSLGALERSVLLVTADHGEELLDHGIVGHGQSLYEELVRVPLLLRSGSQSGALPTPAELVSSPVGHVDVAPTLVEAAGLEPGFRASGRSLLCLDEPQTPRHTFSEVKHKRRYQQSVHEGRYKLTRSYRFRKALMENGTSPPEDYNNLHELFAERPFVCERRLYDLEEDRLEMRNLAEVRPEVADRLEAELERWWGGLKSYQSNVHDLEDEMIRRLEALGYL